MFFNIINDFEKKLGKNKLVIELENLLITTKDNVDIINTIFYRIQEDNIYYLLRNCIEILQKIKSNLLMLIYNYKKLLLDRDQLLIYRYID